MIKLDDFLKISENGQLKSIDFFLFQGEGVSTTHFY